MAFDLGKTLQTLQTGFNPNLTEYKRQRAKDNRENLVFKRELESLDNKLKEQEDNRELVSFAEYWNEIKPLLNSAEGVMQAQQMTTNRLNEIKKAGGDPRHTALFAQILGPGTMAPDWQQRIDTATRLGDATLEEAYQRKLLERPPAMKLGDLKEGIDKNGRAVYFREDDPDAEEKYSPIPKDIRQNLKPAINKETGKPELVDFNNPQTAQKYDPIPTGMKFEFEGGELKQISTGGADMSKRTQGSVEASIIDATRSLHALDEIKRHYDPNFLTYGGKIQNWANAIRNKVNIDTLGLSKEQKESLGQYTKFVQGVNGEFNNYRRIVTGAAASVQELESLKKAIMNTDQAPVEFEAAYDLYREKIAYGLRLAQRLQRAGFTPGTKRFQDAHDALWTTNADDDADARADDLEEQGLTQEEISDRLTTEGYDF